MTEKFKAKALQKGFRVTEPDPSWVSSKFQLSPERAQVFRRLQSEANLKENQLMRQLVEWALDHAEAKS